MLTEAYLHSDSEIEREVQESRKYSILSILAILLKMICGKRVIKINEENEDKLLLTSLSDKNNKSFPIVNNQSS